MEQYEGKVVKIIKDGKVMFSGLVVGCDYDIGVTIVNTEDKDDYLYCLVGPSANPEIYRSNVDRAYYNETFENLIAMFKKGFIDVNIDHEIDMKYGTKEPGIASPEGCAFNK